MGVQYENGNVNTPVIVIQDVDDDNVLVARLSTTVVPKNTISETEGTPSEDEGGNETDAES